MRAMVLERCAPIETRPLKLQEIKKHQISRPDEVLLRIEACGVCHSQLHSIEGDWQEIGIPPVLPTVPGHEVVGIVEEVGGAVTGLEVGDRAGITPLLDSCRSCTYCESGCEHLCESSVITGESLRGGYAEYITVPEYFATKVPRSMDPRYAAPLFCAGITAYKAVKAAEPDRHRRLGIFGIGGVGHMAVQFAASRGCQVTAVSRNEEHLAVARRLGASSTARYEGAPPDVAAGVASGGGPLDAAIVLAPADGAVEAAAASVRKGGMIVIATVGGRPPFMAFEEKTIRGTLIGSPADMAEVVRECSSGRIDVVYQEFPLEEANEALGQLKESRIPARAVLVP
ncbi:MAG: alcohol dehydrogenase catalytic domain-containing protein [Nitrosopumilus sp.]|nr:alcohol dehydrogenase catalytic domain-containing protein [Nitrosopumilus sp.]MDA7943850.1 alcohol dehydrogenase catalytic domain-containing protein [Nitrosopumilus sp.]MDA7999015.1 alcohol dehydrogenase catalytic domain-containing protein [Nitrosopumilus sp.]